MWLVVASGGVLALVVGTLGWGAPAPSKHVASGEQIVKTTCVQCHRIDEAPAPRRTKKAPDLIWAGNKYQRDWLEGWLQNPDFKHYPVGYDFRPERKSRHLALPADQAKEVAGFLAKLKDARITEGVMKPATPDQLARGEKLYREHGCQNCHLTPAKTGKGYVGGTSSTSFIKLGDRLNADWVYRFNQNPDDFEPDSGAYIPKPPLPDEDIYAITAYMMTFK
jgi:mono/diheme cytochrome c family protein